MSRPGRPGGRSSGHQDWRPLYRRGIEAAGRGDYRTAIDRLTKARRIAGDVAEIDANLGQALVLAGRAAEAVPPLERARARAGDVAPVLRPLALAYQQSSRPREAEAAYRALIDAGGADAAAVNNLAVLLQAQGRTLEAATLLESAVRAGAGIEVLNNLANLQASLGRFERAEELFRQALAASPLRDEIWRNVAVLHRDRGAPDRARAAARRALLAAPSSPASVALLAELAERGAELDGADRLVRRLLCIDPEDIDGLRLAARIRRRRGDPAGAAERLRSATTRLAGHPLAHRLLFERALALDASGDPEAAFAAFRQANAAQMKALPPGRFDPARPLAQVEAIRAVLPRLRPPPAPGDHVTGDTDPVFLVGFPRSGTTLLDQILDSHPGVTVLEERPLVAGMLGRLAARGHDYPTCLPDLDAATLDALRAGYVADRDGLVGLPDGAVFVDKMPLNIVHAALIRLVFPGARFLLALRHPADVCLSCFMQAFELNDWMAVFTSLDDTARLYRGVFRLWAETRDRLALRAHAVRYEALTAALEAEAGAAVRFLGLDWDPAMAEFHRHARTRRTLATPSFSQVTRPIYRDAVARWRRYAFAMDPIAAILSEEIETLGYGVGDG